MSEIRILHISLTKNFGGIAAYRKNLISNIDRSVYKFEFVTPYSDAMLMPYLEEIGCKVHIVPAEKTVIPYFIKLYKIIKNGNFDAVHIHKNSLVNPLPFFAAKLAKTGCIIAHSHNTCATVGKAMGVLHIFFALL